MVNDTPIPPGFEDNIAQIVADDLLNLSGHKVGDAEALIHPLAEQWVDRFERDIMALYSGLSKAEAQFRECSSHELAQMCDTKPVLVTVDRVTGRKTYAIEASQVVGLLRVAQLYGWWLHEHWAEVTLPEVTDD